MSIRLDFKGDYMGFTYNGKHSSELGIVRVNDGSRFNENLLPTMQDKTVQVPGGDGTYYFGSYYTQRQFNLSFAFDSLTEEQIAQLRSHFGDKKIHDLVFDETPYKVYSAKATGTATIKYIPFAEGETNRIYKGEGSIQFTCYQPFARSKFKYLDSKEANLSNKREWALASGMLETQGNFDKLDGNKELSLYNPGDKEADWTLSFSNLSTDFTGCSLSINGVGGLVISSFSRKMGTNGIVDSRITIDSKTNLIEGWYKANNQFFKSGNLYNEYVVSGDFFKIPVTREKNNPLKIKIDQNHPSSEFKYDYYYL